MKHFFVAETDAVAFIQDLEDGSESVLKFTLDDAKTLKAYLETAIDDVEHHVRMDKEELLASLRQKVQELEEHLASA